MTTTKSLPTTVAELYPPLPACDVTDTDTATQRAQLARGPLEARHDQLTARRDHATIELPDLILAGKPTDALLDELADIDLELARLDVKIAALSQAECALMRRRFSLERTDAVYRAWDARCREINTRWSDAMSGLPKMIDGASVDTITRARRSALFGLVASVQSDQDDYERSNRDSGRLLRRSSR